VRIENVLLIDNYIFWHRVPCLWPKLIDRTPSISARCYSRGTAEDASAESKSPGEAPIDIAPIETESSVVNSSSRIYTSMRTDGRGGLDGLTVVTKPSPNESDPDRVRSVSLRLRVWYLQRDLRDARVTVRARVISRTASNNLRLSRHMNLKSTPAISFPCV